MSATVRLIWLVAATLLIAAPARAALTIQITKGKEGALPIAIVPFGFDGAGAPPAEDVAAVISADLDRATSRRWIFRTGACSAPATS